MRLSLWPDPTYAAAPSLSASRSTVRGARIIMARKRGIWTLLAVTLRPYFPSHMRQQFSQPMNIAPPQHGAAVLHDAAAHLSVAGNASAPALRDSRYLHLAGSSGADTLANGFSGHGMQQAPGVGRRIAEPVLHRAYRTPDLPPLSVARLAEGRPPPERNTI